MGARLIYCMTWSTGVLFSTGLGIGAVYNVQSQLSRPFAPPLEVADVSPVAAGSADGSGGEATGAGPGAIDRSLQSPTETVPSESVVFDEGRTPDENGSSVDVSLPDTRPDADNPDPQAPPLIPTPVSDSSRHLPSIAPASLAPVSSNVPLRSTPVTTAPRLRPSTRVVVTPPPLVVTRPRVQPTRPDQAAQRPASSSPPQAAPPAAAVASGPNGVGVDQPAGAPAQAPAAQGAAPTTRLERSTADDSATSSGGGGSAGNQTPAPGSTVAGPTTISAPTISAPTNPTPTNPPSNNPPTTPAPPPTTPAPTAAAFSLRLGTVSVRCIGNSIVLDAATPVVGASVKVGNAGPEEVEVKFTRQGQEEEFSAKCRGGSPVVG